MQSSLEAGVKSELFWNGIIPDRNTALLRRITQSHWGRWAISRVFDENLFRSEEILHKYEWEIEKLELPLSFKAMNDTKGPENLVTSLLVVVVPFLPSINKPLQRNLI